MFPKKGKTFPTGDGRCCNDLHYAAAIAGAPRAELGNTRRAIKTVMRWTGANDRTVKNWFAGARGPCGEHLVTLVGNSDAVFEVFLRLAGRKQAIAERKLFSMREKLNETLEQIDALVDEGK